jgi:putative Holliday junction resolvase
MVSVLALDVGKKRVGVASGDDEIAISFPNTVLERSGGKAESQILKIITEKSVAKLIVGLPLAANGDKTEQCNDIERFARRIVRRTKVELIFVDESHSTLEAAQYNSKNYGIDALAASEILKRYFNLRSKDVY